MHGGGALVFAAGVKSLAGDLADKAFAARVMAEHGPFQYVRPKQRVVDHGSVWPRAAYVHTYERKQRTYVRTYVRAHCVSCDR